MKRRPARLILASLLLGTLLTACQMGGVTLGGGYAGGFGGSSSGGGGIGVNFNLGDIFGWNQAKGDIGTLSRPRNRTEGSEGLENGRRGAGNV